MPNSKVFMCDGCCCGHMEKGNPKVMRGEFERMVAEAGLSDSVSISSPYCLGPCSMANVVKVQANGIDYWFSRMNQKEDIEALAEFLKNPAALPPRLAKRQFHF